MSITSEVRYNFFVTFEDIYIDSENKIWFTPFEFNGLFCADLEKGCIEHVVSFYDYPLSQVRLFVAINGVGDKLVLAPMTADCILVYDKSKGTYEKYPLRKEELCFEEVKEESKFYKSILYKGYVFLIGHSYPAIIKFNPNTGEQEYYTDWSNQVTDEINNKQDIFRHDICIRDHLLLIPCCQRNAVFVFDMETGMGEFITVGPEECNYSGICFDGTDYWLSPLHSHKAVRWNFEKKEWIELDLQFQNDNEVNYSHYYRGCVYFEGKVWMLPAFNYELKAIDVTTNEIIQIDFLKQCLHHENRDNKYEVAQFRGAFIIKSNLYFVSTYNGRFYLPYFKNNIIFEEKTMSLSLKQVFTNIDERCWDTVDFGPIHYENNVTDLIYFSYKQEYSKRVQTNTPNDITIGKRIYDQIKVDNKGID